ncbi:hypothetical protein [Clostridium sp. HBUAS56010]|uniref:hypothetical protein n=1 Tax=Clostridium sp. HBUAS56010 TaxID=2571127 RepID=UPI001177918C|nr:hypothetical protein [Clostridium sp. HBUAS56010]
MEGIGTEEALDYFTERFNAECNDLNDFEQTCYLQALIVLEKELMYEHRWSQLCKGTDGIHGIMEGED